MTAVVHHSDYVAEAPSRSAYRWNKNGLIRDLLLAESSAIDWHEPEPMPREWIETVHDPDYVDEVLSANVPPEKERRIGFKVNAVVARRSPLVVGGTWLAAQLAFGRGYAANSAGGSHHALAATGAGYCIFNDLAIVAVRLVDEGAAERVMVVDCDVHQGDGTAALTAGRPDIATYSIHAEKNFPVRKARSTLDVALPDGTGDAAYLEALESTLAPMLDRERPDIVLYQAGVDPYRDDRLGRLALSEAGLVEREKLVAGLMIARGIPLASTVGGGYGDDALEIAQRHVRAIMTLSEAYDGKVAVAPAVHETRLDTHRPGHKDGAPKSMGKC